MRPPLRRRLSVLLATVLIAASVLAATPAPAAAVTPSDVSALFLDRMNTGRADRGLVAYRTWSALTALATERAGRMAAAHTLSHATAGGNVGTALDAGGIAWMGYGEIIGMSGFAWGPDAVDNIYTLWRNRPAHAGIMFSATSNYIGIGAVQADDGTTWVSAVMTESPDHTAPVARNGSIRVRSNRDVVVTWGGTDPRLQTHRRHRVVRRPRAP